MSTIDVTELFSDHDLPDGCGLHRCHVLNTNNTEVLTRYLIEKLPDYYISSNKLAERCEESGCTVKEVLEAKLPDPGSIMSGEFGEILSLCFLSHEMAVEVFDVPKWRYKQDRNMAAPKSDVVVLFSSDDDAQEDFVVCAEVKAKATANNNWHPVQSAVGGMMQDQISRLAKTLVWLKEKYIADEGTPQEIAYIRRFTGDAVKPFKKEFMAIAVIDNSLLDDELRKEINLPDCEHDFEVVALGIDGLKPLYERVYAAAIEEGAE